MKFIKILIIFAIGIMPALAEDDVMIQSTTTDHDSYTGSARHIRNLGDWVFSAEYYEATKSASLRNQADSILTWRDLTLKTIMLGAERDGFGFRVFAGGTGGQYGYMLDDDLYNKDYQVSGADVLAGYYGFDIYNELQRSDRLAINLGFMYNRLTTDGYVRAVMSDGSGGWPAGVTEFNPRTSFAVQVYHFNNIYTYLGTDVTLLSFDQSIIKLSSQIGIGIGYNYLDWRSNLGSAMEIYQVISPMLMFATELNWEWWFIDNLAISASIGYQAEGMWIGGDTSFVHINKANMSSSDPRYSLPEWSQGTFLKDLDIQEFYLRTGLKVKI